MLPTGVEKLDFSRSKQLLERPAACESSNSPQTPPTLRICEVANKVIEPCYADVRVLIPGEHGIDSFRQLRGALLVDADRAIQR